MSHFRNLKAGIISEQYSSDATTVFLEQLFVMVLTLNLLVTISSDTLKKKSNK